MAQSLILPRAEDDIVDLFEQRLAYSDAAARGIADEVVAAVRRLEQFPESGAPRPDVLDGLRIVPLRRVGANLFYVASGDEDDALVTVMRVLEQRRRISLEDFR